MSSRQIFALTDTGEIGAVLSAPDVEEFPALLRSPTDYVNLSKATPGGSGGYSVNGVSFDGRLALLQAGSQIYIVSIEGSQAKLANTIRPPQARDGIAAQMDASGRYALITAFQGFCATGGYLVDLYVAETLTRAQQSLGQVCTLQLPAIGSPGRSELSVTDVLRSVEGKPTGPVVVTSADQGTSAARPGDVQRGKLSLRMLEDAANEIYGNVFHTDDTLTILFSSTGQETIEVRAAVTARSNMRLAPADSDYRIVASFDIDSSRLSKDLRPASLLRALAASPKDAAALAETAVVQLRLFKKGVAPTATALARIRLTPRPNLIRITDRELVGDRPVEPREWRAFVERRADLPSGGNLQFLRADRTEPTTISVGVYYSPRPAGGTPDALAKEDFTYADDIAIPGQPVQFTVEAGIGMMTVGSGGRREVLRTSRHGLSSTAVERTQQHIELTPAESDAMVQDAGRLTAIRAAIVGGRAVDGSGVRVLRDEQGPRVLAFNERDPSAPDEVILGVNDDLPKSPVRLDPLDAQERQALQQALQRRLHILQAGPSYSSYPNSSSVDRLAIATDTFALGDVMFNLVPLPAAVNHKNVHVAFSAEAAAAIEQLPAKPGVRIVTADVMARAKVVVESIWGEWGAEVHFHDSPDQLPDISDRASARRTVNVLLMSSANVDRERLLASIADQKLREFVQQRLLDVSLTPQTQELPPDSRPTTVKGFTFSTGSFRYLEPAIQVVFQPTGATRTSVQINSLLFVEGFRFLQDNIEPYGSSAEIGTFIGNVIAHEFGHPLGFAEPWMFPGYSAVDEQSEHAPYRRNRLAFDLWRRQLNIRGPLVHRRVISTILGLDETDRQFLKEVFRAP